jgi:tRNA modification GTPase
MTKNAHNIVACLTPPGQGAIATLGLAGPAAWPAVRSLFQPRSPTPLPDEPREGAFWLGRCGDDVADEVVLAVRCSWFEVHCHGGRAVLQLLVELLDERGLQSCPWPDFLRKTSGDALGAEAAVALTKAVTTRTAAILLDQYHGAFAAPVTAAVNALGGGDTATAGAIVGGLSRWAALGRRLTAPWRVAVAGAPNVGKSSLVNALAGYQRSIVAATPGTTRDVVTARIAVEGWAIELADTAGVRDGADALEGQGIELARRAAADADLVLWVLDAAAPPVWPEMEIKALRNVVNKVDLPAAWNLTQAGDAPRVSAATGEGLPRLCARLAQWLVPEPPPPGAAVPFTPALCDAVIAAERLIEAGDIVEARRTLGAVV